MRVLILCQYFSERTWGGPATFIENIIKSLSLFPNLEIHILTIGDRNQSFIQNKLHIHLIKIPKYLRLPFIYPILTPIIKRKILDINPDIIHAAQGTLPPYSTVAAQLCDEFPTLLTVLGIFSKESQYTTGFMNKIFKPFNKQNEKYVISKIPNIVVQSSSIKEIVSKMTRSNISVITMGIDFTNKKKFDLNIKKDVDIFIASRLSYLKGLDVLIKAIPLVLKTDPNIKLVIAGSGPEKNELENLVNKLNIKENIKFLGYISEEEKYLHYKACKIVVVPSRWDCQPFALFDAAGFGKPVIASDNSNPGIVNDGITGLIFESENINDLASKISLLIRNNDLRREMSEAAEKNARNYEWEKIAQSYVDIYERINDFYKIS